MTRKKKSAKEIARDKADAKLTPIIKALHPQCEACGHETQVAHHWIEKSRSLHLRYDIRNLIPLCHSCHAKIHNRFGNSVAGCLDVADIIRSKRGEQWYQDMRREASTIVKADLKFYQDHYTKLLTEYKNITE